ncbi:TPA: antirestriction protein ArdA [Legionella pneumophila]
MTSLLRFGKSRNHDSYGSEVDFAQHLFEECYSNTIPDNLICYFDCDTFARDLFNNDYCSVEVYGIIHVFSNYQAPFWGFLYHFVKIKSVHVSGKYVP